MNEVIDRPTKSALPMFCGLRNSGISMIQSSTTMPRNAETILIQYVPRRRAPARSSRATMGRNVIRAPATPVPSPVTGA